MKDEGGKKKYLLTALAAALVIVPGRAFAAEGALCPPVTAEENIVSVELPVQDENEGYPFDFILDPQGLLYETDAMRYGGGIVEEGATLLFRNREGDYDFSGTSDGLTVTNHGSGSVRVTVSAQVSGLGEMTLQEDADFSDSQTCSVYLALTDSEGHVQPLYMEKETLITYEMDSDTYSFGLTGACNSNADWEYMSVHPVVTVTWMVEPIGIQQKEMPGEETGETRLESGGAQENTPESKGKDVGEEESGMQETGPGSGDTGIGEDNAVQPEDASGKEEADIGEDNVREQEDAAESVGLGIGEDNAGKQVNPSESERVETEMATSATEESEEADAGKESAAAPESGDSGTETEYGRTESEEKS